MKSPRKRIPLKLHSWVNYLLLKPSRVLQIFISKHLMSFHIEDPYVFYSLLKRTAQYHHIQIAITEVPYFFLSLAHHIAWH